MQNPNILIVEDEWIVSEEIKDILQLAEYTVVGQAEDAFSALKILKNSAVDIILMDINIKGEIDGLELATEINKIYNCAIIFLTAFDDEHFMSRAKKVKPAAYIVKPFEERNLKAAIEIAFDKFTTDNKVNDLAKKKNTEWLKSKLPLVNELTPREKEILLLVAKGLSAQVIADRLFISLHTVKTHRKNLWNKLEVENMAELIRISDFYLP